MRCKFIVESINVVTRTGAREITFMPVAPDPYWTPRVPDAWGKFTIVSLDPIFNDAFETGKIYFFDLVPIPPWPA